MPLHTVRQGESIATLAKRWGLHPDSLWEHPDNAELKALRKNPFILKPGDQLTIPDLEEREEDVATEAVHTFVLTEPQAKLAVRLLSAGLPREGDWVLEVDGEDLADGPLDDGWVRATVPLDAARARIFLWEKRDEEGGGTAAASAAPPAESSSENGAPDEPDEDEDDEPLVFRIALHHLDPHDELSGAKQRLHNLGFLRDLDEDGLGPRAAAALRAFQLVHDLDPSGELDAATQDKLREKHD